MGPMNAVNVKRPSLSDEAISRFIDPRTGVRLRPLGVVGGRTVWPMMGASPDDPSDKDDDDKDDDDKGDPDDKDDPEDDLDDKGGDKGDKNPDAKISALEDEKNRHLRR